MSWSTALECFRRKDGGRIAGKGVTIFGRIDAVEGGRSEKNFDAVSKHIIENARPKAGQSRSRPLVFFFRSPFPIQVSDKLLFWKYQIRFPSQKNQYFQDVPSWRGGKNRATLSFFRSRTIGDDRRHDHNHLCTFLIQVFFHDYNKAIIPHIGVWKTSSNSDPDPPISLQNSSFWILQNPSFSFPLLLFFASSFFMYKGR